MSGGFFDYAQYRIEDIAESILQQIYDNDDETLNEWNEKRGNGYEERTIQKMIEAYKIINKAKIYAQRIDWMLSCDDSEDRFHIRLAEELSDFEHSFNEKLKRGFKISKEELKNKEE